MGKVKFLASHKFGQYLRQCPKKKNKKQFVVTSMEIDEYTTIFERYFSLFVGGCIERASVITNDNMEDQKDHSMIVGNTLSDSTTTYT